MRTSILVCLLIGLTLAIRTTHHHSAKSHNLYKYKEFDRSLCETDDQLGGVPPDHFCDIDEDPIECHETNLVCRELFGVLDDECEASWHALIAYKHDCHTHEAGCDEEQFVRDNLWWYPIDDPNVEQDVANFLATHPVYGWVDLNDPVIANAPDFCHESYNEIWQCGYEMNICLHFAGENYDVCRFDWEWYAELNECEKTRD